MHPISIRVLLIYTVQCMIDNVYYIFNFCFVHDTGQQAGM
jgi:hypothetical protein